MLERFRPDIPGSRRSKSASDQELRQVISDLKKDVGRMKMIEVPSARHIRLMLMGAERLYPHTANQPLMVALRDQPCRVTAVHYNDSWGLLLEVMDLKAEMVQHLNDMSTEIVTGEPLPISTQSWQALVQELGIAS